uniref:ACT domain-containing protein ACR9 n=1 Tax=Zea mays TaxID=4577 RepID=A0A804Q518_MAIZE
MELCLNQQAIVEPYTFLIQMAPFPKQIFLNLADIAELPNRTLVDIMAIVVHMDTIHRTMWGPFRKIVIMDASLGKERQDETCSALTATLGPSISCEVVPAEGFQQGFSSLPPEIAEELFRAELADTDSEVCSSPLSAELRKVRTTATVNFDNSLSPAHTLVQIVCADQKGLIYDILRTMKDCNIQIFYGRFRSDKKGSASKGSSGCREVDLFVKQVDGKKVTDPAKQDALRSRLRSETLHSLRVMVVGRGPDTELLVANRRSRRYELEVERKALSMARAWAEEEAKKAREHARALEEARNQWERQGIRVVVEGELKDDASAGVTWANAGKEHAVDESINRAEALLESQDNVW